MNKVSLALIGGGVIGQRHLHAINIAENVELVAIVDSNTAVADLALNCKVPYFPEIDQMLRQCDADGVVVATPTEHHLEPTLSALDAGVHVLIEKPIMATTTDAALAIQKSADSGCHILVAHQRRYYSQVDKAREIVQGGDLGQLIAVAGQWNMRKHEEYYKAAWRRRRAAGPVLTNLIHELDTLRYICGELESLYAETSHLALGYEKEDAAALAMRFKSGAIGTFVLSDQSTSPWSWECALGENKAIPMSGQNPVRFMGSHASLEFPNLVLWHHDGKFPEWRHKFHRQETNIELEDVYVKQIDHFADVIRGTSPPRVSAGDATESLRAALAVFESSESGKRVKL